MEFPCDETLNQNQPIFINIKEEIYYSDDDSSEPTTFSESPLSKISDATDSVELNLNQSSTPIIKHECIDIIDEIYDSDSMPMIPDLESSLISTEAKSYEKLKNFQNSSQDECFAKICDICNKIFASPTNLRRHYREKHENKNYICKICKETFPRECKLKIHESEVHYKKCDQCNILFSSKYYFRKHNKTVHTNQFHKCDLCGKYFALESGLEHHRIVNHLKKQEWKCKICRKSFANKSNLRSHSIVHLNDNSTWRLKSNFVI